MLVDDSSPVQYILEFIGEKMKEIAPKITLTSGGSVGTSPSATAHFLTHFKSDLALNMIASLIENNNGMVPCVSSIDIFEMAWISRWIQLLGKQYSNIPVRLIKDLQSLLEEKSIICYSSDSKLSDSDDTAVAMEALHLSNIPTDPNVLQPFFKNDYFLTYLQAERGVSISANVHVLSYLLSFAECPKQDWKESIINFLVNKQNEKGFWADKWHISPYYTTGETITALSSIHGNSKSESMISKAINWILCTQGKNGGWGYLFKESLEESSYAVMSLCSYIENCENNTILIESLMRGWAFLMDKFNEMHREITTMELWVGKVTYSPIRVVKVGYLVACIRAQQVLTKQMKLIKS